MHCSNLTINITYSFFPRYCENTTVFNEEMKRKLCHKIRTYQPSPAGILGNKVKKPGGYIMDKLT
jgi:hypothetical protein